MSRGEEVSQLRLCSGVCLCVSEGRSWESEEGRSREKKRRIDRREGRR